MSNAVEVKEPSRVREVFGTHRFEIGRVDDGAFRGLHAPYGYGGLVSVI